MTRREWLAAIAALGLSTCDRRQRQIVGSLHRGAIERGHQLRAPTARVDATPERTGVTIVGGGIAGLSAAWALRRAGFDDFVLLELEPNPGGTAAATSAFPWGAHYITVPPADDVVQLNLLEELGAVTGWDVLGRPVYAEQVLCREPRERVFYRGEWHEGLVPSAGSTPRDHLELAAFEADMRRWADWRDPSGRRAFASPRRRASDDPRIRALDRATMADYLRSHGWASERLHWLVDLGCRDDYGLTAAQTSAWAGIHYYAARLADGSAPTAPFLTWPDGNGHIVRHLVNLLGDRLRSDCMVADVDPSEDGVMVSYRDPRDQPQRLRSSHAILAVPRFVAGRVVSPWRANRPPFLDAMSYGSWAVANLTLSERPPSRGFPMAWDNVIYDSDSLGYVVATHQAGRDHGPTVWTWYQPIVTDDPAAARARLLESTWDQWSTRVLDDLGPAHPGLRSLVERIDIRLWGHAMVRPVPGLAWSDALQACSQPLGRIHFAHTDLAGIALFEEAFHAGIAAARAVLRDLTHPLPGILEDRR